MYDVQVMLKEAVEKVKDIEVCGQKGILAEYLNFMIDFNEREVYDAIHNIILYTIYAKYHIYSDTQCYLTIVDENKSKLSEYIDSNPELYRYAESVLLEIKDDIISTIRVEKVKADRDKIFNNIKECMFGKVN